MAYDEELADRIRAQLADEFDVVEKKMFGGLGFLIRGHMAVAASRSGGLLARTDRGEWEAKLALPGVEPMAGNRMKGWVIVAAERVADDADLARWVDAALDVVAELPPK
jgi:TfoX N-terminal domain